MPQLFIITGSNGAGKSSLGPNYLPIHLQQSVFDGDKLFMQKRSEFFVGGIRSHKECKKLAGEYVEQTFDKLVEIALQDGKDFAYEGHFTNDATWDIPRLFKQHGYIVQMIFFGLTDIELSEARVIARSNEGGHYVDPPTIAANYFGNLEKLDQYFTIFDSLTIIDTSGFFHKALAVLKNGICVSSIALTELPIWFSSNLPNITEVITGKTIS